MTEQLMTEQLMRLND